MSEFIPGEDQQLAPSPGYVLRQAREARGLSIDEVAQTLKLAVRQVEAIEADAFDELRGLTFARGFVRNYARLFDIDPQPLLDAMAQPAQAQQVDLAPLSNARGEMPMPGNPTRSVLPATLTVLALAGIAFAGWYLGWFRVPEQSQPATPAATAQSQPSAPAPATPPSAALASAAETASAPTVSVAPPALATDGGAIGPSATDVAQGKTVVGAASALPAAAEPVAPPAATVPATDGHHIALRFGEESWVEIRDAKGSVVYSKLHPAGTSTEIDAKGKPPFALVIGNAKHVELQFDQQPVDLAPYVRVSVARLSLPRP